MGDFGTILKTTDGGLSWKTQGAPSFTGVFSVDFPFDAITGYAVGGTGILKTSDGGENWVDQDINAGLSTVQFPVDVQTGFALGGGGAILKTTDGGTTFVEDEAEKQKGIFRPGLTVNTLPNPFSEKTEVRFQLKQPASVKIAVYNILGQFVRLLASGPQKAGTSEVSWNGIDEHGTVVSAGAYFVICEAKGSQVIKKIVLIR